MFNSPVLDVTIGLVFIFLVYSLLATSIKEAIATLFGLRARMLKTGITDRMLSDTPSKKWWASLWVWLKDSFLEVYNTFISNREKPEAEKKIGDKFYDHPMIKNYGSSRIFPIPSYIAADNFSTVIIDVLKQEFEKRVPEIAAYKRTLGSNMDTAANNIEQSLLYSTDMVKMKEIIEYYSRHYSGKTAPELPIIDSGILEILSLHLRNSMYDIEKFRKNIENWFDDSMNRMSGWYKRQTQVILFVIGITLAIIFNVDTIAISGKLSADKDARDKLVQMAEQATETYKNDPRVMKTTDKNGNIVPDISDSARENNKAVFKEYQLKADSIREFIRNDVEKANNIIAIGWEDYGKRRDSAAVMTAYFENTGCFSSKIKPVRSTPERHRQILDSLYDTHWIRLKAGYVLQQTTTGRRFLGFLLTAFAICLGAPFWFDLLSKLVKLRAAGKKEDSSNSNTAASTATGNASQPVTLNVNTQTGEEAVG